VDSVEVGIIIIIKIERKTESLKQN
jgi:hypothetical protein